jgi:hypothetical protein
MYVFGMFPRLGELQNNDFPAFAETRGNSRNQLTDASFSWVIISFSRWP